PTLPTADSKDRPLEATKPERVVVPGVADPERKAAEHFLKRGCRLSVEIPNQPGATGSLEEFKKRAEGRSVFVTQIYAFKMLITNKDLELLSSLRKLNHLNLSETAVDDNGLKHLKDLRSLKVLRLASCRVSDA